MLERLTLVKNGSCLQNKKRKKRGIYFRLLRTTAAAITAIMIMAAAIATYKATGVCAVGGGALVGVEVTIGLGVPVTGGVVVGVVVGATDADGAGDTPMAVSAVDG